MNKKLEFAFVIEGVLSFCLAVLMYYVVDLSYPIFLLSIPFELIGNGLRSLSLLSYAGNITALLLYTALSLIPFLYLMVRAIRHKLNKSDLLLPIISLYSFYMIYLFINPQLMINRTFRILTEEDFIPMIKLSYSIIFYTLLTAYLVLNMVSHLNDVPKNNKIGILCTSLSNILIILSGLYTFYIGYFISFDLFQKIEAYFKEDRGPINLYYPMIDYVLTALPIIFTILILISGVRLLLSMVTNHMQEKELYAAKRLSSISKQAVYITILCNIASNVLQCLLAKQLNDKNYTLTISLLPLIIAFLAMILSGYFKETMELYEDNNMII